MSSRPRKTPAAAASARVQFEVIENPNVTESPRSIEDIDGTGNRKHGNLTGEWFEHRPGVFYFRRSLRAATTREQAVQIGRLVVNELRKLAAWASTRVDIPDVIDEFSLTAIEARICHCVHGNIVVEYGLNACLELERLQAQVYWDAGKFVPRWVADQSEADEKGWRAN